MEYDESRQGVKYYGDKNLGKSQCSLKVGVLFRATNVNSVPVRKLLLGLCSLMDNGHDVYFTHDARCYAVSLRQW